MSFRKKLIEVALPLEAINAESAREKSIRHGHPSTLHLWWARRPLAACRAVLFAQLVDDPSAHPEKFPTEVAQETERQRLFELIEKLVKWENINDEKLLEQARALIRASAGPDGPPPLLDPFAGGGSIPLEAQRLGLEAHASDLNPVAVLINKALIEIPPKFAGQPPVHPQGSRGAGVQRSMFSGDEWRGAKGLAEDVRYYGRWMRDEAEKRIGHLYPKVKLPAEYGGGEATVIAWLWARTVPSPNPAANGALVPLVRSFALSTKKGKETWVEPVIDRQKMTYRFEIRSGEGIPPEGTVNRKGGVCLLTGISIPFDYIRANGKAGRMGVRLMGIIAESKKGRIYLSPMGEHEKISEQAKPDWLPDTELPYNPFSVRPPLYGFNTFAELFTSRQLVALTTFSDLVSEVHEQVKQNAKTAGIGDKAVEYAHALSTYLGLAVSRSANTLCSLAMWSQSREQSVNVFSRQALPMIWDFPEVNPFAGAAGDFGVTTDSMARSIASVPGSVRAFATQQDAAKDIRFSDNIVIATDPPYYDNIDYADLSDFFYIWLRRALSKTHPTLFSTLLVPKNQELVATPYRFGGDKHKARQFFEEGLHHVFKNFHNVTHSGYPVTIYYAFKQSETEENEDGADPGSGNLTTVSTGWETMLGSLIQAGFTVTGTWPLRTERPTGVKVAMNALASSIVLVCRPRPEDAPITTRRDFLRLLKQELPAALRDLQRGNIAPVDLAQASIGPGMAIFSRHKGVLEADGSPMRVRTALALINQALDEYLAEQEGEYDADTRWALAWYEQFAFNEGPFGDAETLSKAKNTSVGGMVEAGILAARGGKVRLIKREELRDDWDPTGDARLTVWEVAQYLIHTLDKRGESGTADLLSRVPAGPAEAARDLAYRLYTLCERKGWAGEALPYNSLVVAWPEVVRLAGEIRRSRPVQGRLI